MNNLPAEKENSLDSEVSRPDQGEYLNPDDQLIYCSKCHTPKQMWIEPNILFSESRKVPVRCACRKKEHELAQQAKEQQERDDLVRRLYQSSCFPAGLRECTFDLAEPYHQDTLIYAKAYAEKLVNDPAFSKGILLYGPPGTGKTYTAACIANHLIQSLQPVLHASVGYILSEYNACKSFSETVKNPADYLNDLLKYRLIILDDLGSEYQSAYQSSLLFEVVNFLDIHQKPLVVTTNLSTKDLLHPKDLSRQRVNDRIIGRCIPMPVLGEDLRIKTAKERRERERERIKNEADICSSDE